MIAIEHSSETYRRSKQVFELQTGVHRFCYYFFCFNTFYEKTNDKHNELYDF